MNFLQEVAKDLLQLFGHNLSEVTVVFPGKRARLFMNQYLAEACPRPVWAPRYKTIDELVQEMSTYRKADTILSVCLLYRIYASLVPDAETLDEFYNWGEVILSDFDDIDKHLAPAEKIFQNVYDLHAISTDYITPEQEEALREFFHNFSIEGNSEIKRRFLRLWDIMPQLYRQLREQLASQQMLYAGAQYRDVAEQLKQGTYASKEQGTYAFVGFNILDEATEQLFRHYQQAHQALFYWDYDQLYCSDPQWEAGLFINQNRRIFPNALDDTHFDHLRHLKDITFIATSTDNAQSRYIPTWVRQHLTERENETAVVLADEHRLGSVLHSLPEDLPRQVNVTMGFPLADTPVFSFLNVLIPLYIDGYDSGHQQFRYTFMERVKRHPYYPYCPPEVFAPQLLDAPQLLERLLHAIEAVSRHYSAKEQGDIYDQLYTESLFQTHLTLTRFWQMMQTKDNEPPLLSIQTHTLQRLLRQVLSSTSIPFHGEPAVGMQVMGLLETRNLDFRHLMMLNVGEGILPKKTDDTSLIPYTLRESFGLTTIRHRISVFAYYFYRLISRAEHVTLLYNENTSGATSNEMSRFMRQLMAETDIPIQYVRLIPSNEPHNDIPTLTVEKTPQMQQRLLERYVDHPEHHLSPSAINTYLDCSLKFYYRYIAGIRVPEQPEDGITPALFGILFHDAADLFYRHQMAVYHTTLFNEAMLKRALEAPDRFIYPCVDASLLINYLRPITEEEQRANTMERWIHLSDKELRADVAKSLHKVTQGSPLTGMTHIIHGVLRQYLKQLVEYDRAHTPFELVGLEQDFYYRLRVGNGGTVQTGGRIDRLERDSHGRLTVVDYKTGGAPKPIANVEAIFAHKEKNAGYFLQTFIYALAATQSRQAEGDTALPPEPICPTLFYVNRAGRPTQYDRQLYFGTDKVKSPILDLSECREEFLERLVETVNELLFSPVPFQSTERSEVCQYCDFKALCGRE